MKLKKILLTVFVLMLLVSCNRYDVRLGENGRMYKIDKRTGNTWITIKGLKWTPFEDNN